MPSWRYVKNELDETYAGGPIPPVASENDLPPQDFEVRQELAIYKLTLDQTNTLGFLSVLFRTTRAKEIFTQVQQAKERLMALVNKSAAHKAAIRRIVNDMPEQNDGRKVLAEYLK